MTIATCRAHVVLIEAHSRHITSSYFDKLICLIYSSNIIRMADTSEANENEKVNIETDTLTQDSTTANGKKSKAKRKTRSQRRKEKLQKLQVQQQQSGEDPKKYDYRVIVKDNPNLVKYYRLQSIIAQDEFDKFLEGLRATLPASFRINTFDYGQAIFLRQLVQGSELKDYLSNASNMETKVEPTNTAPVLEPLPWYPQQLAWQMNVTRNDLKKTPILQKLHIFIMAETDNGFISRQESVSMIPPLVLDIHHGQKILDMCAAPGSKTAQLLEYLKFNIHNVQELSTSTKMRPMFDDGLVVANDVDNKRCYMLVHQSNRLNSPNCVIINEDASRLPKMKTFDKDGDDHQEIKFDRILCDAPCSGDGTVRKNPDVWRKWTTGNANNFHGLQSKILKRGVELLKEDGLIVYSTCSMNPVENEAVVASILRLCQGGIVLEDCSKRLEGLKYRPGVSKWVVMNRDMEIVEGPESVKPEQSSQIHTSLFPPSEREATEFKLDRCVRILPHIQNTGAFFVALMRKVCSKLPWETDGYNDNASTESTNLTETTNDEQQKRRHAPNPKKRRYGGFREDPFVFMDSDDADWHQIRQFYGLSDDFPVKQLMHRSSTGKKRSIHLVSKETRNFMIANREESDKSDFVKLINGGMRLFARAETEAGFRICQDGVNEIVPYVKEDLKVVITKDDLTALLVRKSVPMSEFSHSAHLEEKLKPGSCILMYKHEQKENNTRESISVPLVAWRGERSITLYVSNTFKVHLRALVDMKIGDIGPEEIEADNVKSESVDDQATLDEHEPLKQESETN